MPEITWRKFDKNVEGYMADYPCDICANYTSKKVFVADPMLICCDKVSDGKSDCQIIAERYLEIRKGK